MIKVAIEEVEVVAVKQHEDAFNPCDDCYFIDSPQCEKVSGTEKCRGNGIIFKLER